MRTIPGISLTFAQPCDPVHKQRVLDGDSTRAMNRSSCADLGRVVHRGLDDLAWGEAPADPGLDGLVRHLRELSPVDRDMAIHILHLTFRSIQELGREP